MKKYMVYVDDGCDLYKFAVPADNQKKASEFVKGCGKIIAVNDVPNDWNISLEQVAIALKNANFCDTEIDYITRCLSINKIAE